MNAITVVIRSAVGSVRHFLACCGEGDFAGAQAIVAAADAEALRMIRAQARRALRRACAGGYLPLAQWLAVEFDLGPAAMERGRAGLFACACGSGHSDVATWVAREFELPADEAHAVRGRVVQRARSAEAAGAVDAVDAALEVYRAEFEVCLGGGAAGAR